VAVAGAGGGVNVIVGANISVGEAVGVSACAVSMAACPVMATSVEMYSADKGVGAASVPENAQPAKSPEREANKRSLLSICESTSKKSSF